MSSKLVIGYVDVYLNSLFTSIDTCTSLAQLGIETDVEPLTAFLLILAHTKTLSKLLFNSFNYWHFDLFMI